MLARVIRYVWKITAGAELSTQPAVTGACILTEGLVSNILA